MPTYKDKRLKPCSTCGVKPVLEHWASGGPCYAVRCDNPDRPDSCSIGFYYSMCRNPEESIKRWNEFQEWPMEDREKWKETSQTEYWKSVKRGGLS